MFRTVLVGVDSETQGSDALALARQLVAPSAPAAVAPSAPAAVAPSAPAAVAPSAPSAPVAPDAPAARGARLVLANVYPASEGDGTAPGDEAAAAQSLELLGRIRSEHGLEAEVRSIGAPRMGAGLHRLAELTGADLVVLGSSRKGRPGRVYLRDESCQALNGLSCALAVAPLDYAASRASIQEVGVAYSGSQESAGAIAIARALAALTGASISAFEALSLPIHDHVPNGWATFTSAVTELEAQAVARIADRFGLPGFAACGEAIDELAVFSGSVDLLIAGSRNYGPPGRLVQGSTTQRLLHFARSPLLILTRPAPAGSEAGSSDAVSDRPVNV